MRRLIVKALKLLLFWLFKLEVEGEENLPKSGPALLCFNHNDLLDSLIMVFAINRDLWGISASNYKYNPFVMLYRILGRVILINRFELDRDALKKAMCVLNNKGFLGIAPEGTRSKNGAMSQAKSGIAFLASATSATIVPIGIIGSTGSYKDLFRHRHHIRVVIGKAFDLPASDPATVSLSPGKRYQYLTDTIIMPAIAELLPEDMRGYYR